VPLDHGFVHDLTDYYGCSLEALVAVLKPKGYNLVCQHRSLNAFFVLRDLVDGYEIAPDYKPAPGFPHDPENRPWVTVS
jgi:hypothetical protein